MEHGVAAFFLVQFLIESLRKKGILTTEEMVEIETAVIDTLKKPRNETAILDFGSVIANIEQIINSQTSD